MPTPATHLTLAQEMLCRGDISTTARRLLNQQRGPFMLGHTAPDVKSVSGQSREASHFYAIPRRSDSPAYQVLFDAHPELTHVDALSPSQAAFVAGYVAHLLVDEVWLDDVFQRYFLQDWGPLRERLFLHNVLRTWVDGRDQARLNGMVAQVLQQTEPDDWLPFVDDTYLRLWRDWLIEQLAPGHTMETAEVLAGRMGVPAEEVEAVVQSPEQMEKRVFRRFPRSALQFFREKAYRSSVMLVNWYIGRSASRQPERPLTNLPDYRSTDLPTIQEIRS